MIEFETAGRARGELPEATVDAVAGLLMRRQRQFAAAGAHPGAHVGMLHALVGIVLDGPPPEWRQSLLVDLRLALAGIEIAPGTLPAGELAGLVLALRALSGVLDEFLGGIHEGSELDRHRGWFTAYRDWRRSNLSQTQAGS